MSMFDWSACSGERVVSHRFWVYLAFTCPITLVIFGACLWFHEEKHSRHELSRAKYQVIRRRSGAVNADLDASASTSGSNISIQRLRQRFKSDKATGHEV